MNYRMIARMLGLVMLIVAGFLLPALGIAIFCGETSSVMSISITIGVLLACALILTRIKPRRQTLYARDGFALVSFTWVLVSMLGALPFYLSGEIPSYIDCLFETVSGFTTTGASILRDVESMPFSLLYWRSFTHWLGGMGVLVFLLAIVHLSSENGDTLYIMRAESPGPNVNKLVPRTRESARILYGIYIAMTVLQTVLLLAGGMSLFDSITTAFGTAGTGGFGVKNDSMASYSPYLQWVVTVFMALFGVNFGVFYLILMRKFKKALRNEELRFYLVAILAATGVITIATLSIYDSNFSAALRNSAFQVVSIITTTGFATADFDLWPQICRLILVVLMVIGASAGSTGGGVKCSRVLIVFKSLKSEMLHMLHPNTISTIRMDGEPVQRETVSGVYAFFTAYTVITAISMLLVSLDNFSFDTTVTSVLACINNIGPGLGKVGPTGNFSGLSNLSKFVLTLDMLIGRLEVFPVLILFMPSVWKRSRRV